MTLSEAERSKAYRERRALDRKIDSLIAKVDELEARMDDVESVVYWNDGDETTDETNNEFELTSETEAPEDWTVEPAKDHQADDVVKPGRKKTPLEGETYNHPPGNSIVSIEDLAAGSPERRERAIAMIRLAEMNQLEQIRCIMTDPELGNQFADYLAAVTSLPSQG